MKIKEILNEAEADWAALPLVEKNLIVKNLKNKTIVICGKGLARCFVYALLYQNDAKNLNIRVILTGDNKEIAMSGLSHELFLRDDFEFMSFDLLTELSNADYVICTGVCGEEIGNDIELFRNAIKSSEILADFSAKTKAKVLFFNDSRVYGVGEPHRVYSENEYPYCDINSAESFETQLMRVLETVWASKRKMSAFDFTTLRTGIILGAGLKTPFDDVFRCISENKSCVMNISLKKYSFVYINDVMRATVYALSELEGNTAYNIIGKNSVCSTAEIFAKLNEIYGDLTEIKSGATKELNACAISGGKIATSGCEPKTSLEIALELSVIGCSNGNDSRLPHSHEGRLSYIQSVQLAYLLELDRICRKHNIKYFLGGGTLLGAIRHKGFIPWDDDADVMMLREDYDKFCKIAQSELPQGMTFQTSETDSKCFYEFAKFRLDDTTFATEFAKTHKGMHNGLAFDIFCHDNTANSKLGQKIHIAMTLFTRALVFNKWNNRKAENDSKIQSAVTDFCKRIFPIKFSMWLEKKTLTFFKNKKNAKYLYDGMGRNIYNGVFQKNCLDEVIYVDFENIKMPVPKKYDEYLRFLYGDYMELAPLSTRLGCHEIDLCDIGKYDGYKIF